MAWMEKYWVNTIDRESKGFTLVVDYNRNLGQGSLMSFKR